MTRFTDGPAAGRSLSLRRSPVFLRVVIDRKGEVDALDQLSDFAGAGEKVYVYVRTGEPEKISAIVCSRGKGRVCRGYNEELVTYRVYSVQPDQAVLTSNVEWAAWAREEYDRIKEKPRC